MADANPYGKRIQNGIRLSCFLIEVGTPVVRKIVDSLAQKKHPSLRVLLNENKTEMRQYLRGSKGKQRFLSDEQFSQLYGPDQQLAEIDLTLSFFLIRNLCKQSPPLTTGNWHDDPLPTDVSLSANLVRLRKIRNTLYAHINQIGFDDDIFEQRWNALSGVLSQLGASEDDMRKWKECPLDKTECTKRIKEIQHSMINDKEAFFGLIDSIQSFLSKPTDLSTETKDAIEKLTAECKHLKNILFEKTESIEDHKEKLIHISSKILSNDLLEEWGEILLQKFKELPDQISDAILERLKDPRQTKIVLQENELTEKITKMISAGEDSYKILLINSHNPKDKDISTSDLKEFQKHVGCVPWDFIIDLDHRSRAGGIHVTTSGILREQKTFHIVTYRDITDITDNEQMDNILGKKAVWLLANGCIEADCPPCLESFGEAKIPFENLLRNILGKSKKQMSLLIMVLVQSREAINAMQKVASGIQDVMELMRKVVANAMSVLIEVHVADIGSEGITSNIIDGIPRTEVLHSSHRNFAYMLGRLYPAPKDDVRYYFPGRPGKAYLTQTEVALSAASMELYHSDIGKVNFDNLEPDEISKKQSNMRIHFLKGHPITPEAIYVNSKVQVYVRRREIDKVKERLEEKLQHWTWDKRERQIFFIDHEASGGGTTVATIVLFELKDKYPCVRVLKINENLYEGISLLNRTSREILLLLIDSDDISDREIMTFKKTLDNDGIKAQLMVTRRLRRRDTDPDEDGSSVEPIDCVKVLGSLKGEDMTALINLYKTLDGEHGKIDGAHRIFPIGLQVFLKDHTKLNSQVKTCMDTSPDNLKLLLRLACSIWKFGQCRLSVSMLQGILQLEPNQMFGHIEDCLGYVNDFLIINPSGEVKLASACVIRPILEYAISTDEISVISSFIEDTTVLIERTKDYHAEELSTLIQHVFIIREREAGGSSIHWSPFIQKMKDLGYQKEDIATHLAKIIDKLQSTTVHPHMQALLARFYMYELRDPVRSINMIQSALGIEQDQLVRNCIKEEVHLLITYGTLYRERVKLEKVQGNIKVARDYYTEAIHATIMAQQITGSPYTNTKSKHHAVPYIQEARAREHLLRLYLNEECKGNRRDFMALLERPSTDGFLSSCEEKAHEALDIVQFLHTQDRLIEEPSRYIETMHRVRFDLLLLRADKWVTLREMIETIPENVTCDFGSLIRRPLRAKSRLEWKDMELDDILFIIEHISKRLALRTVLRSNYEDIITGMIYIKQLRSHTLHDKFNLAFATLCATHWAKRYKDDHHAHFMLGVLKFIEVLEGKRDQVTETNQSFERCKSICKELRSTPSFRQLRYHVGKRAGLSKLIPKEYLRTQDQLLEFEGLQVGKYSVTIHGLPSSIRVFINRPEDFPFYEQQPLVKFSLAFSHQGPMAINVVSPGDTEEQC